MASTPALLRVRSHVLGAARRAAGRSGSHGQHAHRNALYGVRSWSMFASAEERRLARLAEEANLRSHDAEIQGVYLRALGRIRPEEVIKRVEGGSYATGENVAKEYLKALVATGNLDRVKLPEILQAMTGKPAPTATVPKTFPSGPPAPSTLATAAAGGQGFFSSAADSVQGGAGSPLSGALGMFAGKANSGGSKVDPIHVTLAEPSMQQQLWRAVRVLGTTFLVLGFIGVIMEERGVTRGMGINTEMNPEPEQSEPKTFEDVKGCDEAKAELQEIVQFLRSPEKFTRLGGKLPKGVLLVGPPGTGKTLLARSIAGEAGRPFFYASGSEFEEMFVGVGARRVRELFAAAKKRAPCIIFIDELDSVGGKRNPKDQQYMKMTLNQLLVELDGFNPSEGIIVIAATNFPESLDSALVRPGRFDRHIAVPNPDAIGRRQILEVHAKDLPLDDDVKLDIIARGTPGFSGADLANLANIAALKAASDGFSSVKMAHLEHAKDRILMGAERKSAFISEDTRRLTAYHEGGHALIASNTVGALPVHKATIVPRGQALGMVSQLPETDMTSMSRQQMLAKLDVCMGGRAAEELIFGADHVTSGAESDFSQATQLAEAMVTRYGMSEKLGKVSYDKQSESPETRARIEAEVKQLLDDSYTRAKKLLVTKQKELHNLAGALLEYETLTGDQVRLAAQGTLSALLEKERASSTKLTAKVRVDPILTSDPDRNVLDAPNASAR